MAHMSNGVTQQPVIGSVQGSRGAVYFVTTDNAGVISCTCPDFMSGKTAKGTAIENRACKHLRLILAGDYSQFTPAARAGSARALADEIRDELAEVERELADAKAQRPGKLLVAFERFKKVRAKAQAFQDKLNDEITEISARLAGLEAQAQERL